MRIRPRRGKGRADPAVVGLELPIGFLESMFGKMTKGGRSFRKQTGIHLNYYYAMQFSQVFGRIPGGQVDRVLLYLGAPKHPRELLSLRFSG
jgi:hypothetical protein